MIKTSCSAQEQSWPSMRPAMCVLLWPQVSTKGALWSSRAGKSLEGDSGVPEGTKVAYDKGSKTAHLPGSES